MVNELKCYSSTLARNVKYVKFITNRKSVNYE